MKVVHVIKYMGGIERKFGWPVYLNVVLHRFSSAYGTIKPLAKTEFLFILVMILSVGNPLIFLNFNGFSKKYQVFDWDLDLDFWVSKE